jgi:hypothetical protein
VKRISPTTDDHNHTKALKEKPPQRPSSFFRSSPQMGSRLGFPLFGLKPLGPTRCGSQGKLLEPQKRHGPTRLGSLFPPILFLFSPTPRLAPPALRVLSPRYELFADSSPPGHSLINRSAGETGISCSLLHLRPICFVWSIQWWVHILSCLGWNRWLGRRSRVGGDGVEADPEGAQGPAEGSPHILQRR